MKSNNFKKAVSFFALASVFSMAGCQKDELLEETATAPMAPAAVSNAVDGKYIVVMKGGNLSSTQERRERLMQRLGISRSRVSELFNGNSASGFTGNLSKDEVQQLRQDESVAYIEPEQAVLLGKATPSSTSATSTTSSTQEIPWGVARVGYGDGTGKTVWVIDSGVQSSHPDLNVDKARSKSFISGVSSWEDGYGHGTGVAGVIGAKDNGLGVVGVAANATIVALRVFDDKGAGTLTRIYSALNYAYQNGKAGDVVNMSLRVDGSTMLDDLVKKTAAKGMFVVVAAGNSYVDCKADSPARVVAPNVYVVSNMDSNGKFSPTSNFGASVRYAAPG
ncbi:S8 family serine peptidase, partial [Rufibacter immobilis]|uniref:S8 family serine peptidase n=1 Tax=Rufibacter immobilis TaxID=1348778 RepID=UPI0035E5DEF7